MRLVPATLEPVLLRSIIRTLAVSGLLAVCAFSASAQRVLGPGDDATVLPRHSWRFATGGSWTSWDERYTKAGTVEPVGAGLAFDTLGVLQFPNLAGLQTNLRSVTGISNFDLSLGNSSAKMFNRVNVIPITIEIGLAPRLQIGIQAPYVTTRSNVAFNINTAGTNGNIGFNPAFLTGGTSAATADQAVLNEFSAAAAALTASLAACQGSSSPSCSSVNANRSGAQALITSSTAFAGGVSNVYVGSPFVPIAATTAELAIAARIAAFKSAYNAFGVTSISGALPVSAPVRLGVSDLNRALTDPAIGISADPISTSSHSHWGDITLEGKFLLIDTFGNNTAARLTPTGANLRFAVGGAYQFPTGQADDPNNFVDIPPGRHASAVEGRAFMDVLLGKHFWQSAIVRYNHPRSDTRTMRVADPSAVFAPLVSEGTVTRQLGNTIDIETTSRLVVNDFVSIAGQFIHVHKAQDHYTSTILGNLPCPSFGCASLDASLLDANTEATENRVGGGISLSNLYAASQGKAGMPFEVSFIHQQTISGSGGNQPKYFVDQIQIRLYRKLFGASGKKSRPLGPI